MSQFFTILTLSGAAALANGMALGQAVNITSFKVGDGGGAAYDPTIEQLKASTSLVNPVYTGAINELQQDPENPARYYIEGVVPVNKGGWTVREVGWFLENGEMFAVTKFPPSYKSIPADGAATELPIRTYLAIGSDTNVTLKIDPTVVLATRNFVDNKIIVLEQQLATHTHKSLLLNPANNHLIRKGAAHQVYAFDDGIARNINIEADNFAVGDVLELQKIASAGRLDITRTDGVIDVRGGIAEANHYLPAGKVGTLFFECVEVGKLLYKGGY
jgi:phage-related tail fiber protein